MNQQAKLAIWIILFVLIVVGFCLWIFYRPFWRWYTRRNPQKAYYHSIRTLADLRDYYLINEFKVEVDEKNSIRIDHILAGDKYIYLLFDRYFSGAMDANPLDDYWLYHRADGTKERIVNPIHEAEAMMSFFSMQTHVSSDLLVGIVLINDDCFFTPFKNEGKTPILVPISKLKKVISSYEGRDIQSLSRNELYRVIQNLAVWKERGHV